MESYFFLSFFFTENNFSSKLNQFRTNSILYFQKIICKIVSLCATSSFFFFIHFLFTVDVRQFENLFPTKYDTNCSVHHRTNLSIAQNKLPSIYIKYSKMSSQRSLELSLSNEPRSTCCFFISNGNTEHLGTKTAKN